jgi:hypothetical protein
MMAQCAIIEVAVRGRVHCKLHGSTVKAAVVCDLYSTLVQKDLFCVYVCNY